YEGELESIFNGDLSSKVWFEGQQNAGKYVQIDMGGIIDVEDVAVVINDGENDYFREGDLQLSLDGKSWETIHTFNNPDDRGLNFPEHEAPYRYKRIQVDNLQARYFRLIATGNSPKWLALNQIIVNEEKGLPRPEDLTIDANPEGENGYEASQAKDQKLASFYTPEGDETDGYLTY